MRIKAFSLIELIVVILLIGVIFSLILSTYMTKDSDTQLLKIKDIVTYLKKETSKKDGILYIYGKSCKKGAYLTDDKTLIKTPNFGFSKDSLILSKDNLGDFNKLSFNQLKIENEMQLVCFELNYKKGRFIDKLIVVSNKKAYLFSPFYQEIITFDSISLAKESHADDNLYPNHIDRYYHEK